MIKNKIFLLHNFLIGPLSGMASVGVGIALTLLVGIDTQSAGAGGSFLLKACFKICWVLGYVIIQPGRLFYYLYHPWWWTQYEIMISTVITQVLVFTIAGLVVQMIKTRILKRAV